MRSPSSNVTVLLIIFLLVSPLKTIVATTPHNNEDDQSFLQQVCSKLNLDEDGCCKLSKTASFIAYATAAAAVGAVGVPALLVSMGFTAGGITAGSWAALYQSTYGIGTVFSWLQSVSMTSGTAAIVGAKLGAATAAVKSFFFSDDCNKKSTDDQCHKN
jgi:hypothetical protein